MSLARFLSKMFGYAGRLRMLRATASAMCFVLIVALASILFVSRYFNYGAEGIEIAALLRIAERVPYMTRLPEIPWYVNQYSPFFYLVLSAPIRLLNLSSLESVTLSSRLFVLLAALGLFLAVFRHFRSLPLSGRSFLFMGVWFCLLFPANVTSVRPDFFAFLLEFLAFAVWHKSMSAPGDGLSRVALAGLVFAGALVLKFNTVGVLTGLLLYEVTRRHWLRATVMFGVTALSVLTLLLINRQIWGVSAMHDTFLAIQNQMETPAQITCRFVGLGFYALSFVLLGVCGFRSLGKPDQQNMMPLLFAFFASVLVATLQQFKAGAWYNYYYGAFALGAVPAAIGLKVVFSARKRRPSMQFAVLAMSLLQAAWAFRVPAFVAKDRLLSLYPFPTAVSWLTKERPEGAIYSDDPNALLYFRRRVLLGPNAEIVLNLTPALMPYLPDLKRGMGPTPYGAAVATGPNCDRWRPSGLFLGETSKLTVLAAQFGWICIFVPKG